MRTGFVYELKSKDKSITKTYIGSTWDIKTRLIKHKQSFHNKNSKDYNYPLYRYIREHGGFDNFEMTIIDSDECEDKTELHCAEQFYIDMSGGIENLLNDHDALMDKQKRREKNYIALDKLRQRNKDTKRFYCEPCDYAAESECKLELHNTSIKHKKNILK
tara:strand:- start:29 stop:511 length:483 start_codon:yes stop_codon:yes gene_type:complete